MYRYRYKYHEYKTQILRLHFNELEMVDGQSQSHIEQLQ